MWYDRDGINNFGIFFCMGDIVLNYAIRFFTFREINKHGNRVLYFNLQEQFCVERGTIFNIISKFDFKLSQTNDVGRAVPTELFNERSPKHNDVIIAITIAFE